MNELKY